MNESRPCESCGRALPRDARPNRHYCDRECQLQARRVDIAGSMFVRLGTDLHDKLVAAAAERDLSASFLARHAIADFLDRLIPVAEFKLTRDS